MAKREVNICDSNCDRVATCVCPVCRRDLCIEHRKGYISVTFAVCLEVSRPPNEPVPAGGGPKVETNNETRERVMICQQCFYDASSVRTRTATTFDELARATERQLVPTLAAAIAAYKLSLGADK